MAKFPGIHDEASQANAPMDTALENKLKDQEDWLWKHDDFNHSLLYHSEAEGNADLTNPKLASLDWASIVYSPLWITRGFKSIAVDLYCYVSSLQNIADRAGVDLKLELRGFGSVETTIGPHALPGAYLETITLNLDRAIDADLFADMVLWYRSGVETGIFRTGFDVRLVPLIPHEIQCVPGLQFELTDEHCYVVETLTALNEVVGRYQSISADSDGTRIIPHNAGELSQTDVPAQYRALGYIVVRALRVRAMHEPMEVGA